MPPRRFLGIPRQGDSPNFLVPVTTCSRPIDAESGKVVVTDLAGADQETLIDTLLSADSPMTAYVVTPVPMYRALPSRVSSCFNPQTRIFPHLDLDHIRESAEAGLYDGLALGVYTVERSCVINVPRDA